MNDKGAYQVLVVDRLEKEDLEKRPPSPKEKGRKKKRKNPESIIWHYRYDLGRGGCAQPPRVVFTSQHYPPAPLACSPA